MSTGYLSMKFIDEVQIDVVAGHGGPGVINWRREKYVPRGGPDGGNGGRGGHVYFEADEGVNTLVHFRGIKTFRAEDGEKGGSMTADGRMGEDLIIKVPPGTLIMDRNTDVVLFDLKLHGEKILVAEGGLGGKGNAYFKSSVNQAPEFAQSGLPGKELQLKLELKLLADVALIGMPNAGKSTLISRLSAAKPKIADYPFTTLEPNLGVVTLGDKSLVLADVPGLIEGAHSGKGLGVKFLKHIERCKALVHLVDCCMCVDEFEAYDQFITVRAELEKYDQDLVNKREVVCLTKIDAMSEEEIERFKLFFEQQLDRKVLPISASSGRNLDALVPLLFRMIDR